MLQPRSRHAARTSSTTSLLRDLSARPLFLCFTLLVALVAGAPAKVVVDMHAGTMFTGETFQKGVDNGIWLIEHYSPYCHHCKDFAPTWRELVESRKHQAETIDFHLGQVDCVASGDLCESNGVKGYPSIFLYENGHYVEQFKKERTLEKLNSWLDARLPDEPNKNSTGTDTQDDPVPVANPGDVEQSREDGQRAERTKDHSIFQEAAVPTHVQTAEDETSSLLQQSDKPAPAVQVQRGAAEIKKRILPNTDGKLVSANTQQLNALLDSSSSSGPVFVKYYAPWCGHCKHLAPTWVKLADELKNQVTVVEFNCDIRSNSEKCRTEGVQGYPTLIFYNGGEKKDYNGKRDLNSMAHFAAKAAQSTGVREVSASDLRTVALEDEVFFLFLHPSSNGPSDLQLIESAARTLLGAAPVYKSSDSELFERYKLPTTQSTLLLFNDHSAASPANTYILANRATSTDGDPASDRQKQQRELAGWLHTNSYATFTELTGINYKDYMEDGQRKKESYVVVAGFDDKVMGSTKLAAAKADLQKVAQAWRQASKFNTKDKAAHFVWVNANTLAKYLSGTYGMKAGNPSPQIVIADPSHDKYYTSDVKGRLLTVDGRQLFAALESLYDGQLKPKPSLSLGDRFARWLINNFGWIFIAMGNHPIITIFLGISLFVIFFCVLVYVMDEASPSPGSTHQPKFVNSGQSLYTARGTDNSVKKD